MEKNFTDLQPPVLKEWTATLLALSNEKPSIRKKNTEQKEVTIHRNLEYAKRWDGTSVGLDIYQPAAAATTATGRLTPIVIYFHGGAWFVGDRDNFGANNVCTNLCRQKFLVVSVDYALSSLSNTTATQMFTIITAMTALFFLFSKTLKEQTLLILVWFLLSSILSVILLNRDTVRHTHPNHVLDCAAAVSWLYEHAAHFLGDNRKIILCGHSAGGHLCTLLSTNPSYLKSVGRSPLDITACVAISGVYNDRSLRESPLQTLLLHEAFGKWSSAHIDAFPIYHVEPGLTPPFFILNAEFDSILHRHTKEFVSVLQSLQVYVETKTYPAQNHFSIVLHWDRNQSMLEDITDFIKRAIQATIQ